MNRIVSALLFAFLITSFAQLMAAEAQTQSQPQSEPQTQSEPPGSGAQPRAATEAQPTPSQPAAQAQSGATTRPDAAAQAEANPAAVPESRSDIGKFVIVPAENASAQGNGPPGLAAAWRLDTETGDVDFCIYKPGGVLPGGGGATSESLRCVPQLPTAKARPK